MTSFSENKGLVDFDQTSLASTFSNYSPATQAVAHKKLSCCGINCFQPHILEVSWYFIKHLQYQQQLIPSFAVLLPVKVTTPNSMNSTAQPDHLPRVPSQGSHQTREGEFTSCLLRSSCNNLFPWYFPRLPLRTGVEIPTFASIPANRTFQLHRLWPDRLW